MDKEKSEERKPEEAAADAFHPEWVELKGNESRMRGGNYRERKRKTDMCNLGNLSATIEEG